MTLREEVARAIAEVDAGGLRAKGIHAEIKPWQTFADEADAVIAIVLAKVESHLSAVQYSPSPYTGMKYRLRALAEEPAP
ncbi:hypothetical protein [Aurantiacibacter spongiae]|uniref:Uncharacterized protein n=1 Tax=Aurantiacibacter spongiae TaxID=2488860 RepID=A0A3N5CPX9_9SPHN|nr:hypothetical protein [Aurantiacibacter spongiae]RPF70426.1 hypothetical protein EG799_01380 [Aurantiacibacter spongiae]